jgi:hypothetical protein
MKYLVEWIAAFAPVALVVFLVAPWLSLLVLMATLVVAVAGLVALTASLVAAPYLLARYVHRLWLARSPKEQSQALQVPLAVHTERI